MKKVLPRTLGFFLITLLPVVYLHVMKLPTWGEVIDGIFSSLVFALPFALGFFLIKRFEAPSANAKQEVYWGMISAAFMWAVVWVFWSVVPESFKSSVEVWAFNIHLAVAFITGILSTSIWTGQLKKA